MRTENAPAWILGTQLTYSDQQQVLRSFVHRMTTESRAQFPDFTARMLRGGYRMPEKSDAQWLAETRFAVTASGRLDKRVHRCMADHDAAVRDLAAVKGGAV